MNNHSPAAEKIALFRSFFRGREDVYPRRFESQKTGKSGYSPVCGNEWVRGICEKPKIKCLDCQHRRFLPITDEVIQWHLLGSDNKGSSFVMGMYPMLLDESCFFLAVDFDKSSWEGDAVAFFKTCHQMDLPAALERSRSGKGAHVQDQWVERLATFLDVPRKSIGKIGGGKRKSTGVIDVATIQSLIRKKVVDDCVGQYGHVVVDECHHLPADSFEDVVRQVKGRFITGLSATVVRKDGRHPIITMRCGPIRYCVSAKEQASSRPFDHFVWVRPTDFYPEKNANQDLRIQFQDLYGELINDINRNQLICNDFILSLEKDRSPIVLTERNEHLDYLFEMLKSQVEHVIVLRGGMSRKAINETMDRIKSIPENEIRVLIATGRFIGEGFDDARLDTLFLTLPVSWRGTVAQYVGRLHRLYDSKKEVQVYDYADLRVPMLERMFNTRCKAYEAVGYKILLPASASPGWPANIPLPVGPPWKVEHAASVKRLIRDGVDEQLAHLFKQLSIENKAGVERARSNSEAFLYCRLESPPETKSRFQLNVELPIPFGGLGSMEVDLLCADARIAVEIDGAQHFSDTNAYRRDRRKDVLLQENGYMVLRFLAEDIGKYLDDVLDSILRALSMRMRKTD